MEDNTQIRIGGIKFSEELVQVTVACNFPNETSFNDLLHLLAGKQINIPFICHSSSNKKAESSFCVLLDELGRIQEVLNFSSFTNQNVRIIPSVGTLTLFPHRNSFRLLGLIMGIFAENRYPIHSLGTSISAVAVNTDFHLLDDIAEKLKNVIILPENHAPFRQEFRLTQQL
ncbi:MAG: hypothetical protein VR65_23025 [Desulfobulbaceae bacterium BRH_c16a]|nr:MAG: hypothetical protein VR65_23025 [Desulfobulbaceae bacterium BRH_c16a]